MSPFTVSQVLPGRKIQYWCACKKVVTVEDGVISGGLGSAVLEFFADHGYEVEVKRVGIPNKFVMHGTVAELRQICGMDAQSIAEILV